MRKTIVAMVAAFALLFGVGLVSAAPASASPRSNYLREARHLEPKLVNVGDYTLWKAGKATCHVLDIGGHFVDVIKAMKDAGVTSSEGAAVIVAAVHNLCPGHTKFLNNFVNS
jgi:hypothetical protein